ncbi:hypothetical protein [Mycoplasma putrefaciens]|uniref:Transmembrane protein n=1 Tax=Mycoplasma putrefaciens Mput9231 TaxID=1292033 RepID=M9WHV0_9MOLU|nr:hypothetical protein [Mycoplasma putrefaciens]AGJ91045.1 Hypothetical protein, predicted transmembrane protein [Mycoplasma putrefaciens Mput9231]
MKKIFHKRTWKTDAIFFGTVLFVNLFVGIAFLITNIKNPTDENLNNIDKIIALDSTSISIWGLWIASVYSAVGFYRSIKNKQSYCNIWVEFLSTSMQITSAILFLFLVIVKLATPITNWSIWLKIIDIHIFLPIMFLSYLVFFRTNIIIGQKQALKSMWRIGLIAFVYLFWIIFRVLPKVKDHLHFQQAFAFSTLYPEKIGWPIFILSLLGSLVLYIVMYWVVIQINNLVNKKDINYEAKINK